MEKRYIGGQGASSAKLMIVGEFPGTWENNTGQPIAGQVANLISQLLVQKGSSWNDTYRTTLYKHQYRPREKKILSDTEEVQIWKEIEVCKPNCILALGGETFEFLSGKSGIREYRGSILQDQKYGIKLIGTIHPGCLFSADCTDDKLLHYSGKQYIAADIKRAISESNTPTLSLPSRILQIARSSHDVYNFFRLYGANDTVAIDIESFRCIPTCISFAFNSLHAISIPLWNVPTIGDIPPLSEQALDEIWLLVSEKLNNPSLKIVGQNFKYDHEKLISPAGLMGWPPRNIWADIMLMAHTLHSELPKSLQFLTSIYTREPYYKNEYKEFDPSVDSIDRILSYNAKDSAVTIEIYEALILLLRERNLEKYFFEEKMPLHSIYLKIEGRGFSVDKEKQDELQKEYQARLEKVEEELFQIVGHEFNVRSNKDVPKVLFEELGFPEREHCDEDTLIALAANHGTNPRKARALYLLLENRRIRRTISTDLYAIPDFDGKMRSSWNIAGTETGRSSTGNLESPLRPYIIMLDKNGKEVKKSIGISAQTIPKHGENKKIRKMYVPPKGYIYGEADLSQAEPRVVAILAKDEWLLQAFREGRDVHKETASWFFGVTTELVTKEMRFIGKGGRNGGAYDEGKHRLMMSINTDAKRLGIDITISEARANEILTIFHKKSPNIRGIFHKEIREAVERNRTLVNPYGRPRTFFNRYGDQLFKEAYADIPQSTVRNHVAGTLIYLDKKAPQIEIVCETHDGFLFQSPIGREREDAEIIKEHMERSIDFSRCTLPRDTLTIPCEIQFGENYADLKKV